MIEAIGAIPQTYLALAAALFGGGGLKAIEYYLNRGKLKEDQQGSYRTELRTDINRLRADLDYAEKESDYWRNRYYLAIEKIVVMLEALREAGALLKSNGIDYTEPPAITLKELLDDSDRPKKGGDGK